MSCVYTRQSVSLLQGCGCYPLLDSNAVACHSHADALASCRCLAHGVKTQSGMAPLEGVAGSLPPIQQTTPAGGHAWPSAAGLFGRAAGGRCTRAYIPRIASKSLWFANVWAICRWLPSLTKGQRAYDEPYGLSNTAAAEVQVIDYLLVPKQRPTLK